MSDEGEFFRAELIAASDGESRRGWARRNRADPTLWNFTSDDEQTKVCVVRRALRFLEPIE